MIKIKKGQKIAWVSKQDKNGWSLGLAINKTTFWLKNIRFTAREDVVRATCGISVVFIELKNK